MNRRDFLRISACGTAYLVGAELIWASGKGFTSRDGKYPNIVYILTDDLGYGDISCLNPDKGKVPAPHIDGLAREGMVFTDCHAGSSICTPTRYGLLTGRHAWPTRLQEGVINTAGDPPASERE